MLKKQLNSIAPLSRFLLRRGEPVPLSSIATCSTSYDYSNRNRILQISSPFSSSTRTGTEENRFSFSSCRILQNPRINLGFFGQNLNLFSSDSSSIDKLQCWKCNFGQPTSTTPFLVCQNCRSVQPVNHSIDYFQILGLERKYEIEDDNLEGKYKDWQKKLHPDLVHTKTQKEREYAAEQSARVSDAYRTLTNPLSRAKYIMKLQGVEVDEEERITDPELLAEVMEIREAVEEEAETEALHQIQSQIQRKLENWSRAFANAFESRKYDEALTSIQRMTYYKRAIEEIVKKL